MCDSSGVNPEFTAEQFPSLHSECSGSCLCSVPELHCSEMCSASSRWDTGGIQSPELWLLTHIKHKLLVCPGMRGIQVTKAGTSRGKCAFVSHKCLLGGVWTTVVGLSKVASASSGLQWVKYLSKKAEAPGEVRSLSVSLSMSQFSVFKVEECALFIHYNSKRFQRGSLLSSSTCGCHEAPLVGLWTSLSPSVTEKVDLCHLYPYTSTPLIEKLLKLPSSCFLSAPFSMEFFQKMLSCFFLLFHSHCTPTTILVNAYLPLSFPGRALVSNMA